MPALPTPLPPTPTPSIHSPTRQNSCQDFKTMSTEQPIAGPSHGWRPYPNPPRHELPPTPPVHDDDDEQHDRRAGSAPSSSINFNEPNMPTRRVQPTRRPASAYPAQTADKPHPPYRKYTDPTPHHRQYDQPTTHQLDVDLDAYSTTEFGTEEGMDEREPTLSFVTTSTLDSTASTPSMGVTYGYRNDSSEGDGKIRMRQTAGRAHAYSSAESSMASGAYSGYGYADQIYNPHPPPLPHLPSNFTTPVEHVGLGISADFPQRTPPVESPSSNPPLSPSHSFTHRPWKRDIVNRLRSNSASSSITTASCSTSDSGPSSSRIPPLDNAFTYTFDSFNSPWEQPPRAEAIAMVDEGRENILNVETIENMGGFSALTVDMIGSFAGVTHLLLPSCGSHIISFLPSLLEILAPSLVALDISDNDLSFLPETLQNCTSLEELNVSGNPLRQIPAWIGDMIALRVLAVDSCGLQCLPAELAQLGGLHTLCVRQNKLVSLPSWLCLLGHLEMLRVDNNPFAAEWVPIVTPILAGPSRLSGPSRKNSHHRHLSINNGIRSPPSMASLTSSLTASSLKDLPGSSVSTADQTWTGTTNSATHSVYQLDSIAEDHTQSSLPPPDQFSQAKSLRKMRSAGALLGSKNNSPTQPTFNNPPPLMNGNLKPNNASKFASLGSSEGRRAASAMGNYQNEQPSVNSRLAAPGLTASSSTKTGKWGFLRKMSMHKLRGDKEKSANMTASASANLQSLPPPPPPPLQHTHTDPIPTLPSRPTINGTRSAMTLPTRSIIGTEAGEFGQISLESPVLSATLPTAGLPTSTSMYGNTGGATSVRGKRRSFLPLDLGPPSINISIPSTSPFIPPLPGFDSLDRLPSATSEGTIATMTASNSRPLAESASGILEDRYAQGLESIKSYLRDLFDLSRPPIEPYGGFEVVGSNDGSYAASSAPSDNLGSPMSGMVAQSTFSSDVRRARRPTLDNQSSRATSVVESDQEFEQSSLSGKKFKNDKSKRAKIVREIYETERTYVRGLGELVSIYVRPSCQPVNPNKSNETIVPASERKIVFGGVESILTIHRDNFLPALEKAVRPLLEGQDDDEGSLSASTAHHVGEVFRTYIAYMKQYSTYINNFDNALSRMKTWSAPSSTPNTPAFSSKSNASPGISAAAVSVGMSAISSISSGPDSVPISGSQMSTSQKKRVKTFLKRCKEHPKHSQINLESYLLLPIQRVPRYKLLLEDLAMCTPPRNDGVRDTLDDALNEIASLASLMNEEKREADSRLRLLSWQQRISKSGPSPLVQPHRRLVLEGPLSLIRLVKKASAFVETESTPFNTSVDLDQTLTTSPSKVVVPVEFIKPELVDRQVMLVLCSDLMVLATQRNEGWEGMVDLFNVLRMATLREPASIVHGNVLRVVDNKSIYYFNGASHENTIQWCRAINSARKR
ncbi:uncharacterized protein L201_003384 [Kwoniella dendrophila CBS 6074]|uniref:DH domain-containing protein n=1 Tax=Kwoniella dendrophila CBS 6074 TaxID=1295534 RepID=A0AAX4JUA7_9TREE